MKQEIGCKIKELRKLNGLTQKELAFLLHKSPTGVASWEQGLSEPGEEDIRKLCFIFHVSADELLEIE